MTAEHWGEGLLGSRRQQPRRARGPPGCTFLTPGRGSSTQPSRQLRSRRRRRGARALSTRGEDGLSTGLVPRYGPCGRRLQARASQQGADARGTAPLVTKVDDQNFQNFGRPSGLPVPRSVAGRAHDQLAPPPSWRRLFPASGVA